MDLDNFDEEALVTSSATTANSAEEALRYLDLRWYAQAGRAARLMDIIGDYAGSEPFILDGTSSSVSKVVHIV
jgi:hypothetical protein